MGKKIFTTLIICALSWSTSVKAGNKILYYFNQAVDNSVSTTINAVYLNHCAADTFVAYINRAKYTIDIAQYDYNQGSYANIATAINNAYTRGVLIRWIYDGSSSNTGLSSLNAGIYTLGSPTTSHYGIMHHKFVLIDAGSANPDDAIVWTGSFDWSSEQFNTDANNAVIIQDSALAHAYTAEFNQMWGGTGIAPNLSASKFGPDKTDLGRHSFTIEGKHIELYFSPSDETNDHIQDAISSANTDLYFGMYTFTYSSDATMIVSKHNSGVYVAGIDDSYSNSYSPYTIFNSGLGGNFKVYTTPGIFHNKYLIVDPSDKCSDPLVLTGSHNWTTAANTQNDENTLIIHDDTAANIYYQYFHASFAALGGTLSTVTGCPTGTPAYASVKDNARIYPNPSNGEITIQYTTSAAQNVSIVLCNMLGQVVKKITAKEMQPAGSYSYNCTVNTAGIYVVQFCAGNERFIQKVVITQ